MNIVVSSNRYLLVTLGDRSRHGSGRRAAPSAGLYTFGNRASSPRFVYAYCWRRLDLHVGARPPVADLIGQAAPRDKLDAIGGSRIALYG